MPEEPVTQVYRFGRCELQPHERRLLVEGEPVVVTPRAFDVLTVLVERAGHLVTKDELCARVWPRLVVEENNLQQQVSALRKILGAEAIATVPGHGYRFEWALERVRSTGAQAAPAVPVAPPMLGRLPQPLTSFVGRVQELAETRRLLASARLLTLVGMGGIGKTRLSLELAAGAASAHPDGVWFVDLAPLRDPTLVAHQLAQSLGIQEEAGQSALQAAARFLRTRRSLIVLDNCEHLVASSAELAQTLLSAAPALRIIATSRETLRVGGEQVYRLLPLAVPVPGEVGQASSCDAVRLFVDRARLQLSTFSPVARESELLGELCTWLEGIPLALELAAARIRTLSIADINQRLRDRFRLLVGGSRGGVERQRTLLALLDWSYELLRPDEQVLCDRLGVFAGGFDFAAAEAVCSAAPLDRAGVLELLSSLVDKSLVLVEERGAHARYRMLETMREYVSPKLQARGEAAATAARHGLHFLELAKEANRQSSGVGSAWAERIETELDNLRAAIAFALAGGAHDIGGVDRVDGVVAVKLEVALLKFRLLRGHVSEGRRNIRSALALPAVRASSVAHAHALYVGAGLAAGQGEHASAARGLEDCLALRREIGNRTDIAATLSTLALVRLQGGDAAGARDDENRALALFRELGDRIGEAISLLHLGQIEMARERKAVAREHFAACLRIAQMTEQTEIGSECERMIGELALEGGDVDAARAQFAWSLDACRRAGDRHGEALSLWGLARANLAVHDAAAARAGLHAALRVFLTFGMKAEQIGCLEDFALLAQASGDHAQAARLLALAGSARERLNLAPPTPCARRAISRSLATARHELGEAAFRSATQLGREAGFEDEVRRAAGSAANDAAPG